MHEIPGVEKWGFEALFQRVVRQEWVRKIKTMYLGNDSRFKFFPPVTIAMLPCENDMPRRDYGGVQAFEFKANEKGGYTANLPGLHLVLPTAKTAAFPAFGQPAILQWDKSKYAALAIDGQHRISALRAFVPREGQKADQADLPAAFLVFDPKLPAGRDLIQVTREIFIDINRNAKTVDESRLILLDDRNFYNCLTRSLILEAYPDGENASEVKFTKVDAGLALELPLGIPQELIDTAAGRESADATKLKDWQFTSAFILNRALQYFVFENEFEKFEKLLEAEDFAKDSKDEMEAAVAVRARDYEISASDTDEGNIPDSEMLSFQPTVTEKLVERMLSMHKALLLGTFSAFTPYREHINKFSKASNGKDANDIRSLLLSEGTLPGPAKFETAFANDLKADEEKYKRIRKTVADLSKPKDWEEDLVWYSVFQRGVLFQPLLLKYSMELAKKTAFTSRQAFADCFVFALNTLYNEGLFARKAKVEDIPLWNGVALKINDNGELGLDGSDGAAKRTGYLIRLLVTSVLVRKTGGSRQLNSLLQKNGIVSALTSVQKGYFRYAKAKDSLAGTPKNDPDYEKQASKDLIKILKRVADTNVEEDGI